MLFNDNNSYLFKQLKPPRSVYSYFVSAIVLGRQRPIKNRRVGSEILSSFLTRLGNRRKPFYANTL